MPFFDLNIPYYESDKQITDKSTRKTNRLKLVIKSMELGYTGVAYNRTIKGVMSESERCDVSLFPLSSILKLAPSISNAVKFHRELLGVATSTPFRQYTRLTVVVDSPGQASALNSGNPILKSYDIVAVKPLNQIAFEQACQTSEVDLIAIEFSEKLPFRLKQFAVKAAIQRGVYFEITYANLLMDPQVRRQMITNAKLLVDWTRGKNLIFSSAAPSVTELRGPNDLANLSSLLGLSMERAKSSISKNCRSLIANALKKKHFYKDAIRVEAIPSRKPSGSVDSGFKDWLKWDPLSSGEGDLQIDDMKKGFTDSNKLSNSVKAIDFSSALDSFQIQDLISTTGTVLELPDTRKSSSAFLEKIYEEPKISIGLDLDHHDELLNIGKGSSQVLEKENLTKTLGKEREEPNISMEEDLETEDLDYSPAEDDLQVKDLILTRKTMSESPDISNDLSQAIDDECEEAKDMQIKDLIAEGKTVWNLPDSGKSLYEILANDCDDPKDSVIGESSTSISDEPKISTGLDIKTNNHEPESRICVTNYGTDLMVEDDIKVLDPVSLYNEILAEDKPEILNYVEERDTDTSVRSDDVMEIEDSEKKCSDVVLVDSGMNGQLEFPNLSKLPLSESLVAVESNTNPSVTNNRLHDDVAAPNIMRADEDILQYGSNSRAPSSGKVKEKRKSHGVSLFPFKRFLSPDSLKKRAKKAKRKQ